MTAHRRSPAEVLADLVRELVDEVHTQESVVRYRTVNRGGNRTARVSEVLEHRTDEIGLMHQLAAAKAAPAGRLTRVAILDAKGNALRVPVVDDRGQPLIRPRWKWHDPNDKKRGGRTVDTPITQPTTRLKRTPSATRGVLAGAAVPGGSPGWDADGALSPSRRSAGASRPPVTEATWLLHEILTGAQQLRADLRAAARQPPGRLVPTSRALREVVGLSTMVDRAAAEHAVRAVRSWVHSARVVLGYDAAIVSLRNVSCHKCEGRLYVRADASTAVWCSTQITVHGPAADGDRWPVTYPCGTSYPRHTWPDLLATAAPGTRTKARLMGSGYLEGFGGKP